MAIGTKARLFALVLALVVLAAPAAFAAEPPQLPAQYYGRVFAGNYNGTLLGDGLQVQAFVGDETTARASITTTAGWYGGPGVDDPKLIVPGGSADTEKVVTFKVNGQPADTYVDRVKQPVKWLSGDIRQVDLVVPAPQVEFTDPPNGTTGVPVDKVIAVTFKSAVQPGDKYGEIVVRDTAGKAVDVEKSISERLLTLRPKAALAALTTYTVLIPAGAVKDAAVGIPLAQEYRFSFTTEQDKTPPEVKGSDPAPNAKDVPVNKVITVAFGEAIEPGNNFAGIVLRDDKGNTVQASVYVDTTDKHLLCIAPTAALSYGATYTVVVPSAAVRDLAGNALAQGYTFSFTTQAAPDTTPPTVASTDPANNATGVAVTRTIAVTFSEDVQAGSAYAGISLKDAAGNTIAVTESIVGKVLSIKPNANLAYSTTYTVSIPAAAVKDLAGNALAQEYTFSFTTQAAPAPAPGPAPAPAPTPAPAPDRIEKPVQAGATTVAELPGKVKVEVPAAAVSGTNARLLLTALQESEAAPILNQAKGIQPASPVVDVSVKDGQVTGSITVVLSYDPAKIPAGRVPAAYLYSDRKSCWVYLGGRVDPGSKMVSVEVSHLTKFAVFARDPVPAFTDMQGHWAEQVVARLAGMGVVSGYPGNVFKPGAEISRVECAAILVRALGLQVAGEEGLAAFKDSADIPAWARGLVAAGVKAGLVKGYPEEEGSFTFRAGNPVTRAELAVLVARIMSKEVGPVTGTVSQFADADKIPDWAKESVGTAAARAIIKGYEDGTFRAANNVTRSEAAAMILRLLDLVYAP